MSVAKVICAFGVMTAAIVVAPIQIIRYMIRRNSGRISTAFLIQATPFKENECPNTVMSFPEEYAEKVVMYSVNEKDLKITH